MRKTPTAQSSKHILPDLLVAGLKLVICGSAAGAVSAAKGAYYAGPGNRFWSILARTGLTPHQLRPEDFSQLLSFGIGLTDLAKSVSGADASFAKSAYDRDRLAATIRTIRPALLAFNGKRAAGTFLQMDTAVLPYGAWSAVPDFPPILILPSTSGAANGFWDEAPWFVLAERVRRLANVPCK